MSTLNSLHLVSTHLFVSCYFHSFFAHSSLFSSPLLLDIYVRLPILATVLAIAQSDSGVSQPAAPAAAASSASVAAREARRRPLGSPGAAAFGGDERRARANSLASAASSFTGHEGTSSPRGGSPAFSFWHDAPAPLKLQGRANLRNVSVILVNEAHQPFARFSVDDLAIDDFTISAGGSYFHFLVPLLKLHCGRILLTICVSLPYYLSLTRPLF